VPENVDADAARGDAAGECAGAEISFRGLRIPLAPEMLAAGIEAGERLRARISNVRLGLYPTTGGDEPITFDLDGVPHVGALRGRNRSLCVGINADADRAIAVRVLLDGDAQRLANAEVSHDQNGET
jgi:hypothetical protein